MSIAWLFPGQGAQHVGMGKALFESSAAARKVFEDADAALGDALSQLCFEGPMEKLTLTEHTQPALVTTSMATVAALREAVGDDPAFQPAFTAGHSLGEYSALAASGALSLSDAVRLTRLRGQAMQRAVPAGEGAMAAVIGLEDERVGALCAEAADGQVVEPANYNSPGQVVVAGHQAAVDRLVAKVKDAGAKAMPLKVSAPFHCRLMTPAADELAPHLDGATFGELAVPVVANVTGEPNQDPSRARTLLLEQIASPVQWVRTMQRLASSGVTVALELGPGKVLAGLAKRITKDVRVIGIQDPETLQKAIETVREGV